MDNRFARHGSWLQAKSLLECSQRVYPRLVFGIPGVRQPIHIEVSEILVVKPALGYLHGKHFTQGLKLVGAFRLNRSSDAASAFELISQTDKGRQAFGFGQGLDFASSLRSPES